MLAAVLGALVSGAPGGAAITATPVATGLAFPAAFTFARDGRIFYGERLTGEIRIFDPATRSDRLFFTVPDLATDGEQGVLGLALHPDYPATPYVYAFVTRLVGGVARNEIVRITSSGGTGASMWPMFTAPAASHHNGGRIMFGRGRLLYAVIGDNGFARNSQDLTTTAGKVLRMTAWGAVPAGNPFPGSYVFAYGIRNSFGFTFDPQTGRMWETENGPECNDELNRIAWGANYGWGPSATCSTPPEPPRNTNQDGPSPILPQRWYATPNAPTGAAFCTGCALGTASEGRLFFGAWKTGEIRRVTLGPLRWNAVSQTVVYVHQGRILALEAAPDGALYLSDHTGIYKLVLTP